MSIHMTWSLYSSCLMALAGASAQTETPHRPPRCGRSSRRRFFRGAVGRPGESSAAHSPSTRWVASLLGRTPRDGTVRTEIRTGQVTGTGTEIVGERRCGRKRRRVRIYAGLRPEEK